MGYKDIFSVKNKVTIITGGAGLIGSEIASAFVECGSRVVIADINSKKSARLARSLKKAVSCRVDITKEKSIENLIHTAYKLYGRIDVWINCAYPKTEDWGAALEKIPLGSWRKNIDSHLNGYFLCLRKAAEFMKNNSIKGSIINFASIYGFICPDFNIYKNTSMTMPAAYSAIKAGIINLSGYAASYYGRYGIRVNCISPGGVYEKQPDIFVKKYCTRSMLGRMAKAEDIAPAALFLASDAASYITAHNLVIDGGYSAK